MAKHLGASQSMGGSYNGETMFLVACSHDNDLDRCMPIAIFKEQESAQTHRDACDEDDELNFYHVVELPVNPKVNWQ